jgi:hypothetical protein
VDRAAIHVDISGDKLAANGSNSAPFGRHDLSPLVAMVSAILAFSNSAVVRWFSSTITGLASLRIHRAAQGWTRTWYAVGMAPKVAELRSLASDDKR